MQKLYQKNHGLPAVGGLGVNGSEGQKGNSVYFGFVNDFFDGVNINASTWVLYGARKNSSTIKKDPSTFNSSIYYTAYFNFSNNQYEDSNYVYKTQTTDSSTVFEFIYKNPEWNDSSSGYYLNYKKEMQIWNSSTPIYANYNAVDVLGYKKDENSPDKSGNLNIESFAAWTNPNPDVSIENRFRTIYSSSVVGIDGNVYYSNTNNGNTIPTLNKTWVETAGDSSSNYFDYFKNTSINSENLVQNVGLWKDYHGNVYSANSTTGEKIDKIYKLAESNFPERKTALKLEGGEGNNVIIRGKLKMDQSETINLKYPTSLKSDFRVGDVLYFWTDEQQFSFDHKITHMVVLTEELLNSNLDDFLKNTTLENPFRIASNVSTGFIDNNICVYRFEYKINGTDEDTAFRTNFYNLIGKDNYRLTIGEFNDEFDFGAKGSFTNFFKFNNNKDSSANSPFIDFSFDVRNKNFVFNSDYKRVDSIRLNNLYVNNECITNNLELVNTFNNNDLVFESGYIHSFTEEDYDVNNRCFIVNPLNYFNNLDIKGDYKIGAIFSMNDEKNHKINFDLEAESNRIVLPDELDIKKNRYIVLTYVYNEKEGGIKYYSQPIEINIDSSTNTFNIKNLASTQNYNTQDSNDDEHLAFISENIPAEKTGGETAIKFSLTIDASISDVEFYFDSKKLLSQNSSVQGSWYSIKLNQAPTTDNPYIYNFSIECSNNIPNIQGASINSVNDYLKALNDADSIKDAGKTNAEQIRKDGFYSRLTSGLIYNTNDRKIDVTIKYNLNDSNNVKTPKTAHYELVQQGFTDPRHFLDFDLTIDKDPVKLEVLNSHDNGVLTNQFLFKTTVKLKNPNLSNYVSNIKVNLDLESLNYDYSTLQNNNSNAKLFPNIDFSIFEGKNELEEDFKNNYVTITNYILDDESSTKNIEEMPLSTIIEHSAAVDNSSLYYYDGQAQTQGLFTDSLEKTCKVVGNPSKPDFLKDLGEGFVICNDNINSNDSTLLSVTKGLICDAKIPIEFNIDSTSGDTIEKNIITVVDFGNPIPAYLSFAWCIKHYILSYDIDGKTYSFSNYNVSQRKVLDYSHVEYDIWKFSSNKFSFWINPLYLTLANRENENSYNIIPSIFMKGSDEEINLVFGQYRQQEVEKNINAQLVLDQNCFTKDRCAAENKLCLPDYILTKKLFQDDIKSINVYPFDLNENLEFIHNKFRENIEKFGMEENTEHQNVLNWGNTLYITPFYDEKNRVYDKNSFIALVYNYNIMQAKKRNDVLTFIYNGEEFEAERYAQKNNNAPLFVSADINYEFRSNDTLESIENFNSIYQSLMSSLITKTDFKGVLSTFADGYNYITEEIYKKFAGDENAEDFEECLELQEKMKESVFSGAYKSYGITLPKTTKNSEYYPYYQPRTLLYNIGWIYPKYNEDNTIQPFSFVDNMEYYIISKYINEVYRVNNEKGFEYGNKNPNHTYYKDTETEQSDLFTSKEEDKQRWTKLISGKEELLDRLIAGEQFIPYTECYDVYPRIAYNSKENVYNVLMLRKPSIVKEGQYKLEPKDLYYSTLNQKEIDGCKSPYSILN